MKTDYLSEKMMMAIFDYDIETLRECMTNSDGGISKTRTIILDNWVIPILYFTIMCECFRETLTDTAKYFILEMLRIGNSVYYSGNMEIGCLEYAKTMNRQDIVDFIEAIIDYHEECNQKYIHNAEYNFNN